MFWNYPVLSKLLYLYHPITLIYGEHDNLTPSHQGLLAQGIHPHIQMEVISKEFHSPLYKAIPLVIQQSTNTVQPERINLDLAIEIEQVLYQTDRYYSSFWFKTARERFRELYQHLLMVYRTFKIN